MRKIALLYVMMLLPALVGATTFNIMYDNVRYLIVGSYARVVALPEGKYAGKITVAATVEYEEKTFPVTIIADNAFRDCPDLLSVTVAGGGVIIGDYAFADNPKLTSVVLPDSITRIGERAFQGDSSLTYVTPLKHLPVIPHACFLNCVSLKSFPLPANVTRIESAAFSGCESLASPMIIPEGVTKIYEDTFYGCI
jgi:hypothetical protein